MSSGIPRSLSGLFVLTFLIACAGQEETESDEVQADQAAMSEMEASSDAEGGAAAAGAPQGSQLFAAKGCIGCHSFGGGRMVGPDLSGVTERREDSWIIAMVTRPDSMIQADSVAQALLEEFATPMPNQGITVEEANSILSYLKEQG